MNFGSSTSPVFAAALASVLTMALFAMTTSPVTSLLG